jgi:hypothetical protein
LRQRRRTDDSSARSRRRAVLSGYRARGVTRTTGSTSELGVDHSRELEKK